MILKIKRKRNTCTMRRKTMTTITRVGSSAEISAKEETEWVSSKSVSKALIGERAKDRPLSVLHMEYLRGA
jgi:hypothetical protein